MQRWLRGEALLEKVLQRQSRSLCAGVRVLEAAVAAAVVDTVDADTADADTAGRARGYVGTLHWVRRVST
jgi:hypothetical protein